MELKGKDFVIIGLQPWYTDIGSNCKNLAREFARENRVLYVNIPLNRQTLLFKRKYPELSYHYEVIRGKKDGLLKISDNLWNLYPGRIHESINWIPPRAIFSLLNRLNNQRYAEDIREACKLLGFRDIILFNDNDIFRGYYLKELLEPRLYIYYCRDYLRGVDYFRKHARWLEPRHIARADLCLANSMYLASYLKKFNPNSYYIGQGCDLSSFDPDGSKDMPQEIRDLSHPIIGYVGNLTTLRLDLSILSYIVHTRPEWTLVLVGPEDEQFLKSDLHHSKNVRFTGKKPLASLAAFIRQFDVCLNPQLVNDMTRGNYPLKIDEYLAMGKPVVATSTEAMELFSPYCYLADQKEDYIPLIAQAMEEDSREKHDQRIRFARSHTWELSAREAMEAMARKLDQNGISRAGSIIS